MTRTLSLKRESLVALTGDELAGLVGAAAAAPTTPPLQCLNDTVNSDLVCYTRGTTCAC